MFSNCFLKVNSRQRLLPPHPPPTTTHTHLDTQFLHLTSKKKKEILKNLIPHLKGRYPWMTCHVQNLMVWYTFLGPSWQVIQAYYMSTNSLKYHQCMSAVYIYLLAHLFYFTLQRLGRPKLAVYFFRKKCWILKCLHGALIVIIQGMVAHF